MFRGGGCVRKLMTHLLLSCQALNTLLLTKKKKEKEIYSVPKLTKLSFLSLFPSNFIGVKRDVNIYTFNHLSIFQASLN